MKPDVTYRRPSSQANTLSEHKPILDEVDAIAKLEHLRRLHRERMKRYRATHKTITVKREDA